MKKSKKVLQHTKINKKTLDFQLQCSQTTYDEEDNQSYLIDERFCNRVSLINKFGEKQELKESQEDLEKRISAQSLEFLYNKIKFTSLSQIYEDHIQERLFKNQQSMIGHNLRLKYQKINNQIKKKKIQIVKKLVGLSLKKRIKYLVQDIERKEVRNDRIEELEITFYKCECQFITINKQSFMNHSSKKKSHKLSFCIQTIKERKNQHNFYKSYYQDLRDYFDPFWIYKSFQVLFVEGGIYFTQGSIIKQLFKIFDKLEVESQEYEYLKNIELKCILFKLKWKKIYQLLHGFHGGNERICHKCLTINQHLDLFSLGLIKMIEKRRDHFLLSEQKDRFEVFLKLIKVILMELTGYNDKNQLKKQLKIQNSKIYQIIRKAIKKILLQYLYSFDYIDLSQWQTLSRTD